MLLSLGVVAQNIEVKSFRPLTGDMTTTSAEGKRIDQNGEVAALIKVMTTETGFVFEGGTLGIVDTQQRVGEIWVWVPRASRKITILHQQLGGLRDYRYPVEIEADRTYEMVLTTAKIETIIKEQVRMQYLGFQITPPNATLWVNDEIWELESDGTATQFLNFGTYDWRVQAPNYHPDAGRVTLNNANETELVTVNMKPNFGWVEVAGDGPLKDASVYIDDNFVGKAPCKSEALKSGQHTVRVVKKMYATCSQTVAVSDNETTRITPTLAADFAEVTLKVDADADIYVNDERKGTLSWTGPLGNGTYKIECKQAGHETSQTTKEITSDMAGQTITLPAPRPIYGSLNVESNPNFSQLFIDGQAQGNTPKFISEILVGSHEIRLAKEGYADHVERVTIKKDEHTSVKPTLSNGKEIQFTCNVPDAQLEIDGQRMNSANGTYMLTYGQHSLRATAADYKEYTYNINLSESGSRSHNIKMLPICKIPEGALTGVFSVSAMQKVYFASGNLQYQASTKTWRFAENQWDIIGDANKNTSSSYSGWIDLFGWGTGNDPTELSTDNYDYCDFTDWGSGMDGDWRTLTKDEWDYVFVQRKTNSGILFAKATVNGVIGVILLPDDWSRSVYRLKDTNKEDGKYSRNKLSVSEWNRTFAPAGAVFMPAAGSRQGTEVTKSGRNGLYWSASSSSSVSAYYVLFNDKCLLPSYDFMRYFGHSVRLVCPKEN